jgi:hypothetical protein
VSDSFLEGNTLDTPILTAEIMASCKGNEIAFQIITRPLIVLPGNGNRGVLPHISGDMFQAQ